MKRKAANVCATHPRLSPSLKQRRNDMIRRTSFHSVLTILFFFLVLLVIAPALASGKNGDTERTRFHDASPDNSSGNIQLGPRPFFLVEDMEPGELKNKLAHCSTGPFGKTYFSIGAEVADRSRTCPHTSSHTPAGPVRLEDHANRKNRIYVS